MVQGDISSSTTVTPVPRQESVHNTSPTSPPFPGPAPAQVHPRLRGVREEVGESERGAIRRASCNRLAGNCCGDGGCEARCKAAAFADLRRIRGGTVGGFQAGSQMHTAIRYADGGADGPTAGLLLPARRCCFGALRRTTDAHTASAMQFECVSKQLDRLEGALPEEEA
ncbi:hypothetical protein Aduo_008261 [Ancylostoma duodenale]